MEYIDCICDFVPQYCSPVRVQGTGVNARARAQERIMLAIRAYLFILLYACKNCFAP